MVTEQGLAPAGGQGQLLRRGNPSFRVPAPPKCSLCLCFKKFRGKEEPAESDLLSASFSFGRELELSEGSFKI